MPQGHWFLAVVVLVVAINGGTFLGAYSQPMHEEWLYYMGLEIPPAMASSNSMDDVQHRLEAAGYNVTRETSGGGPRLAAAKPSEHDYRAWIYGLGGPGGGSVYLDLQCRTGYFRSDCPRPIEPAMRARLAVLLQDSGLALNANDAEWGDHDFATFDEFFMFLFQVFIAFVSVIVLSLAGAIYVGLRRRERREAAAPQGVWVGPPGYVSPPGYPPLVQVQLQDRRGGHEFETVGDPQERRK